MPNNGVCGVVVTFHPPSDVVANLCKLRSQLQGLVVIDNGSSSASVAPLRAAADDMISNLSRMEKTLGLPRL
jgi:hypothetical protein